MKKTISLILQPWNGLLQHYEGAFHKIYCRFLSHVPHPELDLCGSRGYFLVVLIFFSSRTLYVVSRLLQVNILQISPLYEVDRVLKPDPCVLV